MLRVELTNIAAVQKCLFPLMMLPCGLEPKDTGSYIPVSNAENEPE